MFPRSTFVSFYIIIIAFMYLKHINGAYTASQQQNLAEIQQLRNRLRGSNPVTSTKCIKLVNTLSKPKMQIITGNTKALKAIQPSIINSISQQYRMSEQEVRKCVKL